MNNQDAHHRLLNHPRLIVALDFEQKEEAERLLVQLDPKQCAVKIGKAMFTHYGPHWVESIVQQGFKVFLDLKYHDIPNTVADSCREAAKLGVWMINVHAQGGKRMMTAAKEALMTLSSPPLLIAVTVLTSFSESDLIEIGVTRALPEQVVYLAQLSHECGLDGVVCSAKEAQAIKKTCGGSFLTITPGIRLAGDASDDQRRILTPQAAVEQGADYLVMGRSITHHPNPAQIVTQILTSIQSPHP